MKKLSKQINGILLRLKYSMMPTSTLLRKTNRDGFSMQEQGIIGEVLLHRFKTDEALEQRCAEVLG